jgi:hypothetical protein
MGFARPPHQVAAQVDDVDAWARVRDAACRRLQRRRPRRAHRGSPTSDAGTGPFLSDLHWPEHDLQPLCSEVVMFAPDSLLHWGFRDSTFADHARQKIDLRTPGPSPPVSCRPGGSRGLDADTGGVRKKNSSFLYNATRTMYEREGFIYDRPKGQGNCVMVREVAPSIRD